MMKRVRGCKRICPTCGGRASWCCPCLVSGEVGVEGLGNFELAEDIKKGSLT